MGAGNPCAHFYEVTKMDKSALKNIKLFLFDQDGTLYLGNRLYPFTIEMLETIKAKGSTAGHHR